MGCAITNLLKTQNLLWIGAKTDRIKGMAISVCPRFAHGHKEGKFTRSAWLIHDNFFVLLVQGKLTTSSKIHVLVYYGNLHGAI
jgi:hypothetical protein